MIVESGKYESLVSAGGSGAFSKVEYTPDGAMVLRTGEVKTTDLSGSVRLYFNASRDQVLSGHRYDPMGSGLILMRPGTFYRIYTTLEIVEPIPRGVYALPVLLPDLVDVMMITTGPFREGFVGPVSYTIQPYRKMEAERMTAFAGLVFFEDLDREWVLSLVDGQPSSNRTKSNKSTTAKRVKVAEVSDESGLPE